MTDRELALDIAHRRLDSEKVDATTDENGETIFTTYLTKKQSSFLRDLIGGSGTAVWSDDEIRVWTHNEMYDGKVIVLGIRRIEDGDPLDSENDEEGEALTPTADMYTGGYQGEHFASVPDVAQPGWNRPHGEWEKRYSFGRYENDGVNAYSYDDGALVVEYVPTCRTLTFKPEHREIGWRWAKARAEHVSTIASAFGGW